MSSWTMAVAVLGCLALPTTGASQYVDRRYDRGNDGRPIRGEVFFFADVAVPVGDFGSHVDLGGGGGMGGLLYLDEGRSVALRAEGSFLIYGSESVRVPLSTTVPFVDVDVRTTNSIVSAGIGPQIQMGNGSVKPYVYGTVGFSYFVTESGVRGSNNAEEFASTTNYDDFTLALTGGGGVSVTLRDGENPVSLDFSASYRHNGLTEYLTNGDLRRLPRGGWIADPIVGDANLMTYRVGVSIGLR